MNTKTEPPTSLTPQKAPTRLEGSQRKGLVSHTLPSQLGKPKLPESSSLAKIQQQRSAKDKDSSSIGSKNSSSSSSLPSSSSSSPQKSLSLLVEARDRDKIRLAIAQKKSRRVWCSGKGASAGTVGPCASPREDIERNGWQALKQVRYH
mmetsp:Transcript_1505/g.3089  ORF Transcript_1505/g.3089 Transcript_1505/m.3089 type:complete len:149 (+) Transcript_1505:358-804(+)|eukprot:CAMPEP_0168181556 /NCGR_PEP_ID=MMETSP0139_2-20121125/11313_1 /TAXON_ID=44445 /ORGANISM="Pseudo-nitzschia australis, Strain 10249 10 AB" /LENGTH=148 /DNA_ID=CAMNT_0008102207 /DNA_START=338 /DNA_END=784 /DNA_ORIENTATION=+